MCVFISFHSASFISNYSKFLFPFLFLLLFLFSSIIFHFIAFFSFFRVCSKEMVINLKITTGTTTDCRVALDLIKTIKLGDLSCNRAYDANQLLITLKNLALRQLFRQNPIENPNEILILIYIVCSILSKMHF